jgi:hypothetical protein
LKFKHLNRPFQKWLSLEHEPDFVATVAGIVVANMIDNLSVWVMVVGIPSTGKSEITGSLSGHDRVEKIHQVSGNSMASGVNMQSKEMKGQEEPSLLEHLDGKVMLIPDGTTILSMRSEDRQKFFSTLRSAYDGDYVSSTGVGRKEFKAKFGVIICTTPAFEDDRKWDVQLGERFLKYRPEAPLENDELWDKVEKSSDDLSKMKEELSMKMDKFLKQYDKPPKIIKERRLRRYAQMLAALRTPIDRDKNGNIRSVPVMGESAIRLNKQLSALYTGIAHVTDIVTANRIIRRVTRDSIPLNRIHILESIHSGYNTYDKLQEHTNMSNSIIRTIVDDLSILPPKEYVKILSINQEKKPYVIKVNKPYSELFGVSPLV